MKKILILNRRCIKNFEAGGAEHYTFEISKELLKKGYYIEWFSSEIKDRKKIEILDGIKFLRKGNEFTTHFHGFIYAFKNRKNFIIIDEYNGIGFFTFFIKNSLILIHQLYEEFWDIEYGKFFGFFFKFFEKFLLKLYRNHVCITVSDSTKKDLKNLGFKKIYIIPNKLEFKPLDKIPQKEKNLTLIFLGRLKKTKNPEDAIKVFIKIKQHISNAKMLIIGDGPEKNYLEKKYKNDINDLIFCGYLNEQEKLKLLRKSHFLLAPFIHEGWGRVILEANAMGTPVIAYNVKGLRDSVQDKITGFLVNNLDEMTNVCLKIWKNKNSYQQLCKNALAYATNYYKKNQSQINKILEVIDEGKNN